jgi:hypothetical protein
MGAADVARESGLRPGLVIRFVPGTTTAHGTLYRDADLVVARLVKQLADLPVPNAVIHQTVDEFIAGPVSPRRAIPRRRRR